ncbi:MAG: ABC transporter ATP-binding protein [Planctomycetota bacterium]|jgi:ABC-type lipoprotein export system ATPase subunit
MIEIEQLRKTYRRGEQVVTACQVDSLSIGRGEQVALLGQSGLGKTTLLNLIAGIVRPSHAETLRVVDHDLTRMSESARDRFRGRHVGIVFQTFNLLMPFDALENVMLGALFGQGSNQHTRERAVDLLRRVGLVDRIHHLPSELSVGQIQRVAMCRALINEPELILADEPLGNQDRKTGGEVLDLLLKIAEEEDRTVVMVTHDPQSAAIMQRQIDLADLRKAS